MSGKINVPQFIIVSLFYTFEYAQGLEKKTKQNTSQLYKIKILNESRNHSKYNLAFGINHCTAEYECENNKEKTFSKKI